MEVTLEATSREKTGSSESRRVRSSGLIPAVMYGLGTEPQSLLINARVLLQATLIMTLGSIIGADPATGFIGYFAVLGMAFFWGMGFAGYSVAAGVRSGSSQGAQAATFLFFPALFLAPTFTPRYALKGWLETAAAFNPTTYVLEGMRAIMIEGWVSDLILKGFLVAGGFAFITLSFAVISAKTATEKS